MAVPLHSLVKRVINAIFLSAYRGRPLTRPFVCVTWARTESGHVFVSPAQEQRVAMWCLPVARSLKEVIHGQPAAGPSDLAAVHLPQCSGMP